MTNKVTTTLTIKDVVSGIDPGDFKAIKASAISVVAQAKSLAPEDEGRLRDSIMYKMANSQTGGFEGDLGDKISETPKKGTAFVGSGVNYAIYQEFGTRFQAAQAYLRPALDLVIRKVSVTKVMAAFFSKELQKSVKRTKKTETTTKLVRR
jgi:HK97 gp10 family phage protein